MISIAEWTAEIATEKTDKNHRRPGPEPLSLKRIEYFVDPIHLSFVRGHIHLRLPDLDTVGVFDIIAYPAGDILGRWVEREDVI